jgi:hypothetical protein
MAHILRITQGPAEALTIILANIFLGLVVALLQGMYFVRLRLQDRESDSRGWRYNKHLISVGLVVGLLTIATIALASLPYLGLIWGIAEVVLFVTIARYIYGRSYRNEIRTVEALAWSWPSAIKGLAVGLLLATVAEFIDIIIYDTPVNLRSEVILGAAGLILGGLRGRRVEAKNRPNQGIYLSIRNAVMAGLITSLLVGGLGLLLRSPAYALLAGCITFIIAAGLLGGGNVIKHFLVRSLLWWNGDLPWRLADFLDYAASLIFLRKVGGSYIFLHRLLQNHFASLNAPSTKPDRLKIVDTAGIRRNLERGRNS